MLIIRGLFLSLLMLSLSAFCQQAQRGMLEYQLGAGDMIRIVVFGQDDLSMQTRLPDIGTINYPFLGDIKVVGMTRTELENTIYTGLKGDYLVNPSVSVSIEEYRPFFIHGEVKKPGGYPYQPGLTVAKAAALAGGYTDRASTTSISIAREFNGKMTRMSAVLQDVIHPGDIVTIEQSFF